MTDAETKVDFILYRVEFKPFRFEPKKLAWYRRLWNRVLRRTPAPGLVISYRKAAVR